MYKKAIPVETTKLCDYGCGGVAKYRNTLYYCCSESVNSCPKQKEKNSRGLKNVYRGGKIDAKKRYANLPNEVKEKMAKKAPILEESIEKYNFGLIKNKTTLKRCHIHLNGYKCEGKNCSVKDTWNEKFIMLQLDHIDGNSDNNKPSNLRLLCPNCHSQTESYCSRNKGTTETERKRKRNHRNQKASVAKLGIRT